MELVIIFILILLNGIFSMSEIALVSAKRFKLEAMHRKGNRNAQRALKLAENPNTFLSTVQIGITLIGIFTGIYSGDKITEDVKQFITNISVLTAYAETLSVTVVLILLTFFSIVFGELIPKRIGLMYPEKIAVLVVRPMTAISVITKPFIWLLTKVNNLILNLLGIRESDQTISEEEIRAMVQEGTESGEIQEIEQDIVERVFALGDRKVSALMTHRNDLICFDIRDSLEVIMAKSATEAHSVYPVLDENWDTPLGVVSVKELFPNITKTNKLNLHDFLRKPVMVHGGTAAYKVLEELKHAKIHYAFVVDEYGSVEGMVGMDDIVDALLGDTTEYNQHEYEIVSRNDGSWLIDGQYPYFEFLQYFEVEAEDSHSNFNTVAGLILDLLSHIPVQGEIIKWKDMIIEVVDMDGPRIDKVLLRRK
jgi:putative hemolysin